MDRFLVVDVGSTTTKAVLLRRRGERFEMARREAPTTVEAPDVDVTIGLCSSIRLLEEASGEKLLSAGRPTVPLLATSSAGGGLAMVVTGLVRRVTSRSAELAALGAGAILLDVIALDDGRVPWRKVEALRRVRPDLLLFAGGFDGAALSGPVLLAELVREADLTPKLDPGARLPILYAGNENARDLVEEVLGERYLFRAIDNLRPESDRENLEPARQAILSTFHRHVMSHAPGYAGLVAAASEPVMPTPSAVGALLETVSAAVPGRILVVDVGGATTDVFTAEGGRVFRTVSANLGMSYSALNVLRKWGDLLAELLPGMSPGEIADRVGEKHVRPTRLPPTEADVRVERAVATAAVRGAVVEHLAILGGDVLSRDGEELSLRSLRRRSEARVRPGADLALDGYDLVIGSGGALSHVPRAAAAGILVDALRPAGTVRLGVDRAFVFPHLGILGRSRPDLARELWEQVGFVPLGTIVAAHGTSRSRRAGLSVSGGGMDHDVPNGRFEVVPLAGGEEAELAVRARGLRFRGRRVRVAGGEVGLLLDARGRPPRPSGPSFPGADAVPPGGREEAARRSPVERGEILVRRELAVPGESRVGVGDRVRPETVLATSVRSFPRPFLVDVGGPLGLSPPEVAAALLRRAGDRVAAREPLARKASPFGGHREVLSPVEGVLERVLPDGRVLVRESEEAPGEVRAVPVAEELGFRSSELPARALVAVGDEVDRDQPLARVVDGAGYRASRSPIRGRVARIDAEFGIVLVAPLAEELRVVAGVAAEVVTTTPGGAVLAGEGVRVHGIYGVGEEALGPLSLEPAPGAIVVLESSPDRLGGLAERGVAGLIVGGMSLATLLAGDPPFPVVLVHGFGPRPLGGEILAALRPFAGRPAILDGRTELRAGVRRPTLVVL